MEKAASNGNGDRKHVITLPTEYQQFIHLSRYARYREDLGGRETWLDTITRYLDFFDGHLTEYYPSSVKAYRKVRPELEFSILNLEVMPSMRCMMAAGKALSRDAVAGYNCSFLSVDSIRAFDETMYILMCFHPDTEIVTRNGNKKISDVRIGDQVYSYDEENKRFLWEDVLNVIENPTKEKQKIELEFDDGTKIKCTADHKFLTHNRGWIEAQELTEKDDIVDSKFLIYKFTNPQNKKSYIGYTSQTLQERFTAHYNSAINESQTHFHRAIRKYDTQWEQEILDVAYTKEEAIQKEIDAIRIHDTKNSGYNSTDGGEGTNGYRWTDEQRKSASLNAYVRTDEHRDNQRKVLEKNFDKINATRKTHEYSVAQRDRNLGENNPRFGKTHSVEWKAETSQRNTGKGNPFYGKKHTKESIEKMLTTRKKNAETKGAK